MKIVAVNKTLIIFLHSIIIIFTDFKISTAQCLTNQEAWSNIISIEKDKENSLLQKTNQLLTIQKQLEKCGQVNDSVYARVLHRIALYDYNLNDNVSTRNSIRLTLAAIKINRSGKKNCSRSFCVNSYTNMGLYYKSLDMYHMAFQYFDSALLLRKQYPIPEIPEVILMLEKAQMLYNTGDYQKVIEQASEALDVARRSRNDSILPALLNQRAQSYLTQGDTAKALQDIMEIDRLPERAVKQTAKINSKFIMADILALKADFSKAFRLYKEAINERLISGKFSQVADDYTDMGNIYLKDLSDYVKAEACYLNSIKYARMVQDSERLSKAYINLSLCKFHERKYKEAEDYCTLALRNLRIPNYSFFDNPDAAELQFIGNKELVLVILGNKTELLLYQYKNTGNDKYLSSCYQTALLTDTIITNLRHKQLGEVSKIYWRKWTREFFTNAMEACFLSQNTKLAFYFMEKSRAVLLNDKLNELGASARLPLAEARIELDHQVTLITEQQKLSAIDKTNPEYNLQQLKVLQIKDDFEHYIRSLEKKYPVYYQYKYEDKVPSLQHLQNYLLKNDQRFVHYFMNDTVAYILAISSATAKIHKLAKDDFQYSSISEFIDLCSDKNKLNNHYARFARLSNTLYNVLFKRLEVSKGKVIICPDNFLFPFEALCTDTEGKSFLIRDHIFSYVYSANYLLKDFNFSVPAGDFIGFAPVSFKPYLEVQDLRRSGISLEKAAGFYGSSRIFLRTTATRKNFFQESSRHSIINLFSHAKADTINSEPVLFMYDSVIHMNELQKLGMPATKLAILSACQTNVGRNATGEGIYSLARGFAAAGIPSVAATLWKADEQAMYLISIKFNEYLSKRMRKDEALQKAKLHYMENGYDKLLPYFWSNMILIGNAEPITSSQARNDPCNWLWIGLGAGMLLLLACIFLFIKMPGFLKIKARGD